MLSSKYYTAHLASCNKLCIYHAEQKDIELDKPNWPLDITDIYIENSFIDHFVIPDGVKIFTCSKCLKKLTVPNSIDALYVSNNMLVELEVPNTIEWLIADNNYLEKLIFRNGEPTKLEQLDLSQNCFTTLHFKPPPSLFLLDLRLNMFKSISGEIEEYVRTHEDCYL